MTVVGKRDHTRNRQIELRWRHRARFADELVEHLLGLLASGRRVGAVEAEIVAEVLEVLMLRRSDVQRFWKIRRGWRRIEFVGHGIKQRCANPDNQQNYQSDALEDVT